MEEIEDNIEEGRSQGIRVVNLLDEPQINEPKKAKQTSVKQKSDKRVKYIFPVENVYVKASKNKCFRVYTSFGICN